MSEPKASCIWFISLLEIREVFQQITGTRGEFDAENRYEWVIGEDPKTGVRLNVSRDYKIPIEESEVHVSLRSYLGEDDNRLKSLANRCRKISESTVYAGWREYEEADRWKTTVLKEFPLP